MAKYAAVKTTLWGVFYVGKIFGPLRILKAAFAEKTEAEAWAAEYSKENFNCKTMIEEIKVTIPAWNGMS